MKRFYNWFFFLISCCFIFACNNRPINEQQSQSPATTAPLFAGSTRPDSPAFTSNLSDTCIKPVKPGYDSEDCQSKLGPIPIKTGGQTVRTRDEQEMRNQRLR